jgi:hypothetical protein
MKCRTIRVLSTQVDEAHPDGIMPPGTLIDHKDAFRLVQMGVAEAADEECDKRANVTPEEFEIAKASYERIERGIHPEDYDAYEQGLMTGYDADGNWVPGPNAPDGEEESGGLWLPEGA